MTFATAGLSAGDVHLVRFEVTDLENGIQYSSVPGDPTDHAIAVDIGFQG